jgi:hypothetical protein
MKADLPDYVNSWKLAPTNGATPGAGASVMPAAEEARP